MNCPVCKIPLIAVEREAIEIDWCPDCRGLWFDEGELELLGEKTGRKLETEDLGRRAGEQVEAGDRRCPRCRSRMERLRLDDGGTQVAEIDRCPAHGFWLDRGELGTLLRSRTRSAESDEGVVLQFLGETFETATAPVEGRKQ